jgi:hypothetical protein
MLLGKGIKPVDGVPKSSCVPHMLPRESGQARYAVLLTIDGSGGNGSDHLLHRGVMGVLTGLTRILSRCNCSRGKSFGQRTTIERAFFQRSALPPRNSCYPTRSNPAQ